MGYLYAKPEGSDKTRWQLHSAAFGEAPPLPPIENGQYLVDALYSIGPMRSDGFGAAPVTWAELDAFARQTTAISEPWEAELLMSMSRDFVAAYGAATSPFSAPPWGNIIGVEIAPDQTQKLMEANNG